MASSMHVKSTQYHVAKSKAPSPPIFQSQDQRLPFANLLVVSTRDDGVGFQAGDGDGPLAFSQSLRIGRVVQQKKDTYNGPSDGGLRNRQRLPITEQMTFRTAPTTPSTMNSHRQPRMPCAPSSPPVMAPANSPPNAPDAMAADMKMA